MADIDFNTITLSKKALDIYNRYMDKCYTSGSTNSLVFSSLPLLSTLYLKIWGDDGDLSNYAKSCIVESAQDYMTEEEQYVLIKEYVALVEYCCSFSGYSEPKLGWYSESKELTLFAYNLLNVQQGKSLYLPFAGLSLAAILGRDLSICGEENDYNTWLLAKFRFAAHNSEPNDIIVGNTFDKLKVAGETAYDNILILPPMASSTYVAYDTDEYGENMDILYALKMSIRNRLKKDGRLIIALDWGYTYRNDNRWSQFRNWIVDNHLLKMVIALPPVFKPYSRNSLSLWVIENSDQVSFVDGYSFTTENSRYKCILDYKALLDTIISQNSQYYTIVSSTDIKREDYVLTPARYIYNNVAADGCGVEYKALGELIDFVPKENVPSIDRIISTGDLSRDIKSLGITPHEGNFRNGGYIIKQSAVLLSALGGRIKIGIADKNSPIHKEILAFNPKSDLILLDYLLHELLSDYVERQVSAYSTGSVIPHVRKRDLMKIKIAYRSLEEQAEMMKDVFKKDLASTEDLIRKQFQAYKDETHMKKHAIGQDIMQLQTNWETLLQAKEINNGILCDDFVIGKKHPLSVREMINAISYYIKEISMGIENFTYAEGGQFRNKEVINITQLVYNYCKNNINPEFKLIFEGPWEKKQQLKIYFSPEALKVIFKNIIYNAWRHGFQNNGKDNLIKFSATEDEDYVYVEISNNGRLVDDSMLDGRLFEFGSTTKRGKDDGDGHTHSGLGCYQVRSLMIYDNQGDIEFDQTPGAQFPVLFRLKFNKSKLPSHES